MGYDISNYEAVYPPYGTVKDMDDLIDACHERYLAPQDSNPYGRNNTGMKQGR